MALRKFLFLDTDTVSEYLSQLEGFVVEGEIEQTETEQRQKGGRLGYKILEGSAGSESSLETKQRMRLTPEAQYQRLYELLGEDVQYLESFDMEIWSQIKRGEILEVQVVAQLPEIFSLTQLAESASPLMKLMAIVGQDPLADAGTREAFEGFGLIGDVISEKPIPLLLKASGTPSFKFATFLPRKYLRRDMKELSGDSVICGKVLRILARGQSEEVLNFLPEMSKFLNRDQRRRMENNKKLIPW